MSHDNAILLDFHDYGGYYRGSAKVYLESLVFDGYEQPLCQTFNESRVESLMKIYQQEECNPELPENRVPTLIASADIEDVLHASAISRDEFMRFTCLPQNIINRNRTFRCLRGRHRVEALRRLSSGLYWVADFYSDDLPTEHQTTIKSRCHQSRTFCDGDIYRYAHYYEGRDTIQMELWLNRFGPKRADIKTLGRPANKDLKQALDALVPYVGLWADFKAGTLKRILTMKCLQEFIHYLRHVHRTWSGFLDGYHPWHLDSRTCQALQLLVPEASSDDRFRITTDMNNSKLFPTLFGSDRETILERLLNHRGRITSIFTFLEDTKYLEPCARVLRHISPVKTGMDIGQTMRNCYFPRNADISIEHAENAWIPCTPPEPLFSTFRIAYLSLWIFTMRFFPELTGSKPRIDLRKSTLQDDRKREDVWAELALLAERLGFCTPRLREYLAETPRHRLVRWFIEENFPSDRYMVPNMTETIGRISEALQPIEIRRDTVNLPTISQDVATLQRSRRCGRPYEESHLVDKKYMFLTFVYGCEISRRRHVSSFGIYRDIFCCFFGYPDAESANYFAELLSMDPISQMNQSHRNHDILSDQRSLTNTNLRRSSISIGNVSLESGSTYHSLGDRSFGPFSVSDTLLNTLRDTSYVFSYICTERALYFSTVDHQQEMQRSIVGRGEFCYIAVLPNDISYLSAEELLNSQEQLFLFAPTGVRRVIGVEKEDIYAILRVKGFDLSCIDSILV